MDVHRWSIRRAITVFSRDSEVGIGIFSQEEARLIILRGSTMEVRLGSASRLAQVHLLQALGPGELREEFNSPLGLPQDKKR